MNAYEKSGFAKSRGPRRAENGERLVRGAPLEVRRGAPMANARDRFERRPEDLIAMLLTIQRGLGYLPEDALYDVARLAKLSPATVYGVATFYEQFRLSPGGRHTVKVCRGTACHVRGGARILNDVAAALQVEPGETTEDRSFTLETVACFGSCALAPVVVMDGTVKGRMTPSRTRVALERLREETEASTADIRPAAV